MLCSNVLYTFQFSVSLVRGPLDPCCFTWGPMAQKNGGQGVQCGRWKPSLLLVKSWDEKYITSNNYETGRLSFKEIGVHPSRDHLLHKKYQIFRLFIIQIWEPVAFLAGSMTVQQFQQIDTQTKKDIAGTWLHRKKILQLSPIQRTTDWCVLRREWMGCWGLLRWLHIYYI